MRSLLFALLMAFSVGFANISELNDSSIVETICDLKECQGYVKKSIDSLKNVPNKAISNDISINIQESNSIDIIFKISIAITMAISIIVSGGSIYANHRGIKSQKETRIVEGKLQEVIENATKLFAENGIQIARVEELLDNMNNEKNKMDNFKNEILDNIQKSCEKLAERLNNPSRRKR